MAKVVYGISGEGSGHSSRAREMMVHLESRGHKIPVYPSRDSVCVGVYRKVHAQGSKIVETVQRWLVPGVAGEPTAGAMVGKAANSSHR